MRKRLCTHSLIRGYTMIELLVAMAIIAMLLSIAAPKYFANLDKAKEDVLREDLYILRDALDKFYADKGKYPEKLDDLVEQKYLRAIPVDPFTESNKSWVVVTSEDASLGVVQDVKSSAPNKARNGTWYKDW
ncbi:type II secretion system protein [Chitinimonas sp. BJYL2]|uniref:type II secretion system protein n=1 Tax=Chitinimonas sp. BJYL2 TaxID=2976696 RepID=UPI0022B35CF2|nr:prepilin-type N-terminal cleavage/methylation domain-containing protein [Chitinimonas sp. BJYL2]